jgi:type VI protein secretion system component Hcp
MPTDAYVKFGEGDKDPNDSSKTMPKYLGDCTDADHYWWCQLRDTNFGLTFPDQEKGGESDGKAAEDFTVHFDKVKLTKRVDWASTQLFMMCCYAGKAKIAKTKEEREAGNIDRVTVHVCKAAGNKKFPFAIIEYYQVRIINFKVDMSGPEPSETIEFECDKLRFGYQKTNPYTGLPVEGIIWTGMIEARKTPPTQAGATEEEEETASGNGEARGSTSSVESNYPGLGQSRL